MDTLFAALALSLTPSTVPLLTVAAQVDPVSLGASKLGEYGAIGLLAICALYALSVMWRFASAQAQGRLDDRDKMQAKYEKHLADNIEALTEVRGSLDALNAALPHEAAEGSTKQAEPTERRRRKQTE